MVRVLGAVFFCTLLFGCSSQQLLPPDKRLSTLARAVEIPDVPYFPQEENQCGPASLATLLSFRGIEVSPESLQAQLYIPAKGGSLAIELTARSRRFGMLAYPLRHDVVDLLEELNANNPVLVLQNLGFDWLPRWHFAVAMGYDLETKELILRSGPMSHYRMDLDLFVKTWRRADYWAVVVVPPKQLPKTAEPNRFLQAASELEQVGEIKAAQKAYETALNQWPNNPAALLGLGNTAYAQGNYLAASDYFTRYCEIHPNSPVGWNNLAYSLQKLGCSKAARQSVECAVSLAPDSDQYSSSLEEILKLSGGKKSGQCGVISCPE